MPYGLRQKCTYPGCFELLEPGQHGRCSKHPYPDAHHLEYQRLYNSRRWKSLRKLQLAKEPWCAECLLDGVHTIATEVDHVVPHRGEPVKFFTGKLQSLCKTCHSRKTNRELRGGGQ